MKKSLLALAVLGAFAGAASAQSSVTVYGVVDTGFAHIDAGGDAKTNGIESGLNAASRIGFKGVEDLGNGLKAEFVLENGINTDDGTGGAGFSRLAFLGLNGDFGKVRVGRQDNQVKEMLGKVDPFGASGIVNAHDFIGGYNDVGIPQRQSNMIVYQSKSYSGFSGSVGYAFGEREDNTKSESSYGVRLGYDNGPLNVQFAYHNENIQIPGNNEDRKAALLGATYNFGSFKLHGLYGETKFGRGIVDADSVKVRTGLVGVTVPFGASAIRAEYIKNQNRDIDNADSDIWALSYTYAMSKRTSLYATYVRVGNDNGSTLGLGGGDIPAVAGGEDVSAAVFGINHKF